MSQSAKYPEVLFNVVLVEPEIPNNTGSIGRLCVGSYSRLHLIKPMGFEIDDKKVQRAGLDYWPHLDLTIHESVKDWLNEVPDPNRIFKFSSHAEQSFYQSDLKKGDWLVFGKESTGFSKEFVETTSGTLVKLPFPGNVRCFNLANAAAMAVGEGLRQLKW